MGFVKKLVALVAIAALIYFAPQFAPQLISALGVTGAAANFLGSVIGTLIIAAGTYVIQSALYGSARGPKMEAGKVNVRISDPPRWLNAGRARSGGGAMFGEFDSQGRFWYIIVHSDEILHTGLPFQYFLDDEPVTLDGSGYVYQKEFRLKTNKAKDPAEADGQGRGYIRIWTTSYSETDPVPPRIAAIDAALGSKWTADHKLVGTTFSVICMDALDLEHRYKIYRWRGPFGLGEPAVSIAGDWANVYDPRDPTQTLGVRTTYKPTRNAALIWAWWRTHPFGRSKPESSINWQKIGEQADICDQAVTGIESVQKRYEAGVSFADSKRRVDAEKEILMACDGQIVFDETGKSWVRVGHWYDPTLSFSRNRDIMAMSSVEAQDGESETQGVIVNYIDPDANFTSQPSAAWLNPLYYDPLTTPKFLTVDALACQNHNQAMRLAKGIGMRSQPRHKIGPTVNLRGLQARQERIVTINYDNTFAGDYEIATPVELDGTGILTGFGAVPITASRWTLLPGEEQPKPVVDGSGGSVSFPAITGENVYFSDGTIKIDFPALPREDATYVAEYILTSEITGGDSDPWVPMTVNVTTAVSGPVQDGANYTVRYRYVVTSGAGPAWEYDTISPESPVPQPTDLQLDSLLIDSVLISARAPMSLLLDYMVFFVSDTPDFSDAVPLTPQLRDYPGKVWQVGDTGIEAGFRYYWAVAYNANDTASPATGPLAVNVGGFDFTAVTLDTGASLTRSSTATYRNSAGALTIAAVDAARFNYFYDTATSSWKMGGILLEPAATNVLLYSQDMSNAAWTKTGRAAGSTATRFVEDTSTGQHSLTQSVSITSGNTYTLSAIAKEVAGSGKRYLVLGWPSTAFGATLVAKFDLATGTVTYVSSGAAAGMENLGADGWRCRITATATASASTSAAVRLHNVGNTNAISYTGDGASALDITHFQHEIGSRATSRIPTTSAAVSRSADALDLDWATNRHVADGTITVRYTFDNGTTQDAAMTVSSGHSAVPTNLNRPTLAQIDRIA